MSSDATKDFGFYINHRSRWANGLAIAYILIGYTTGISLILAEPLWLNLCGGVLIFHTLVWAAYLVHDLIHGNIFRSTEWNTRIGKLMLFLTGSCYCRYESLAKNHLAHHKNRADFSSFSIPDFLKSLPKPVLQLILTLEWLYFPALNFILRWMNILTPFLGQNRRDERLRTALLLLLRGSFFLVLALYSVKAFIIYWVAYICFINVLRFIDCFQHTYPVFQLNQTLPRFDLEHEERNTFSNLFPKPIAALNLILLNFGYHNAHHRVVRCPWYLLPQLDAELYPNGSRQQISLFELAQNYHRYRIHRLFGDQGSVEGDGNQRDISHFVGGIGVSFLILREPLDWLTINSSSVSASPS